MKYIILIAVFFISIGCNGNRQHPTPGIYPDNPKEDMPISNNTGDVATLDGDTTLGDPSVLSDPNNPDATKIPDNLNPDVNADIIGDSGSYGDMAVIVGTKKFRLGSNASGMDITKFQKSLDTAYRQTAAIYRARGFTYSFIPSGAINPLSVIEIQCTLSERVADRNGKKVCDEFFRRIAINRHR